MDKYIKFSEVMEYLRNRCDEARQCGHEETYFDLLTIIDGLKNMETVPVSALGKDTNVPINSTLDHIYNVITENERKRGYEQAKTEYDAKLEEIKSRFKDRYYNKGYEAGRADVAPKWIPVTEKMPKEHDTMFAKYWGTDRWNKYMFRKRSDLVEVTVELDNGTRVTEASRTRDGKWDIETNHGAVKKKVVAWHPMSDPWHPLPEPWKGE